MSKLVIIALIVFGLFIGFFLSSHQTYKTLLLSREQVFESRLALQSIYLKKSANIDSLTSVIQSFDKFSINTISEIKEKKPIVDSLIIRRGTYSDIDSLSMFLSLEDVMNYKLDELIENSERFNQIKRDRRLQFLKSEINQINKKISEQKLHHNKISKLYNVKIRKFPNNFIKLFYGIKETPIIEVNEATRTNKRSSL